MAVTDRNCRSATHSHEQAAVIEACVRVVTSAQAA